jgi:hypothetical protein
MTDTANDGAGQNQQQQQNNQQQQAPWYDGKLDAEAIGHIENKGWKKDDVTDVAVNAVKQARELQKHFGVPPDQLLKLPKDTTDEAGWRNVRERLGAPKEAKEYDLAAVKRADGTDLNPALADAMRAAMHKAGTPKDAGPEIVKAVVKSLDEADKAAASERTARLQTERTDLQKEWGTNWEFNRLTAMQGAKRAAGSDEGAQKLVDAMQQSIGYKATMEFWRKIGSGTTEDTFVDHAAGGNPTTRNGAVARLAELKADQAWAARLLKGDAATKREFEGLMQLIHGAAA